MAKQPAKPTRMELDRAAKRLWAHYQHREEVTGADVGYVWRDGTPTKELGIRIHVRHKIPVSELESTQVFPTEFEGFPLDVISGEYKPSLNNQPGEHKKSLPLLMGGVSCGPVHQGAGTIGAIVIDELTGQPSILSNWHVLVGPHGAQGAPITQAATLDNGHPQRDVVAHLGRSILDQDGDAALAQLSGSRPWVPTIYGEFDYLTSIRDSRLGETLRKSGRTTGVTDAKVDGEGMYRLSYEIAPGRVEQRTISGFKLVPIKAGNPDNVELSGPGDSGSLWYNPATKDAIGLHFAGETNPAPGEEHAIACNMTAVARRLQFRMATYDELLAQSDPSSLGATTVHASTAELTPRPDWPEPDWPWWPIPINGPLGPFLPRNPWWRNIPVDPWNPGRSVNIPRRGNPHNVDLRNRRDLAFSVRDSQHGFGRSDLEQLQATQSISLFGEVWPELQRAMIVDGLVDAGSYTPATNTNVVNTVGPSGPRLRLIIESSNMFWNDGVRPHSAYLNGPRFYDVLGYLEDQYQALGYVVVQ